MSLEFSYNEKVNDYKIFYMIIKSKTYLYNLKMNLIYHKYLFEGKRVKNLFINKLVKCIVGPKQLVLMRQARPWTKEMQYNSTYLASQSTFLIKILHKKFYY